MKMTVIYESAVQTAGDVASTLQVLASDALARMRFIAGDVVPLFGGRTADLNGLIEAWPVYATVVLAITVLVLARRLRRTRAAMRGLASEVDSVRGQLGEARKMWSGAEARVNRLLADVADISSRQRSLESRLGKPDPKLAAAMSRAGTRPQQMVDCGLSHSEVHLLNALASARSANVAAGSAVQ